MRQIYDQWNAIKLILRILGGLILGIVLAVLIPGLPYIPLLGTLFVGALKAIAPFLVFFLILAALSKSRSSLGPQFKTVIFLYILSTVISAVLAVLINFAHPITLTLDIEAAAGEPARDLEELIGNLAKKLIQNPVSAMVEGNYLGVLFWGIIFGLLLKKYGEDKTIDVACDISSIVSHVIRVVINFAPIGIFGIVYDAISENSLSIFTEYGALIVILVVAMLIVMFVTNPILVFLTTRRNPYPLLFKCLKTSALTAFFTRSSAANIPVNMQLADDMKLDKNFYSVSIPLGATINMNGAAITITTMALVTAFTVGVDVPLPLAILLCIIATVAACGASGVAGGSLLLIPLACSMFGIGDDIAMQVVAIGFIIGVIQDSMETALNSSSDILFTAAADIHERPDGEF
ncbi:MAG: serine/threonine transporter SstT, partial [archaeon]|nr:serine/threonine transporter SstT [archaeon]